MPPPKQARVCVSPMPQAPSLTGSFNGLKIATSLLSFFGVAAFLLSSRLHGSSLGNASHGFIRRKSQTHVSKLSRGGPVLEISCAVLLKCWWSQSCLITVRCFVRCTCEDGGLLDVQREGSCQASTWLWHDLCRLHWVQGFCVHLLHLIGGSWMFIISWVPDLLRRCIIGRSWQVCHVSGRLASVWNVKERGLKIIAAFAGRNDTNFSKTWSGFVASRWLRIVRSWLSSSICVNWRWIEFWIDWIRHRINSH